MSLIEYGHGEGKIPYNLFESENIDNRNLPPVVFPFFFFFGKEKKSKSWTKFIVTWSLSQPGRKITS